MNDAIQTIMTRPSVRAFLDKPVPEETVERLLRAAMAAPSAKNSRPWAFVLIRDRAELEKLGAALPNAKMTATAPLAVAICGVLDKTLPGEAREYWIQDGAAATENFLLAVHALGLGAVWTGVHPISERIAILKETLRLPDGVEPFCLIPFGWPAGPVDAKDKWDPAAVHTDVW
ncbi:MAG: nitroreductase family protein [Lentisphaeria bacterium]|nr:nitroreductase family protein [Lentisphaeria bacterium]